MRVWLNNCATMMPQRYNVLAPPISLELKEMGVAAIVPQSGGRSYRSPLQRSGRGWRSPAAAGRTAGRPIVSYGFVGIAFVSVSLPTSPHANVLGRLVPNGLPKGKKADTRPWVDFTNEAQHVETHEVSVERAEEKSAVNRPGPVWSFNNIRAKSGLRAVLARRSSYAHEVNAKRLR